MKRLIAFFCALFLTLSLIACNSGNTRNGADATSTISSAPSASARLITPPPSAAPSVTGNTESDAAQTEIAHNISADIIATNAYALNVTANAAIYRKNSDEPVAPASTAKLLTALTVLDYYSLDDAFTVGPEIELIASDSSRAWLNNGDTLTVRQLLVALLLPSGNDAAYTIAVNAGRRIAGDNGLELRQAIKVFVNAMNEKAKAVGAASSNFVTPDGYDADGQYSTAFDLAQIARECLGNDALSNIMGRYKVHDTWLSGREVTYINTNELINPNSGYYYPNAVGLKTGTSGNAGSCLVSAAVINGQTYICVVMGSSAGHVLTDCLKIYSAIDPTISLQNEINMAPSAAPGGLKRRR